MDKLIKKSQFKKALISQPFFIWNSLKSTVDFDEVDDEDLIDLVWDTDEVTEEGEDASQKIVKTFRLIDEWLLSYLVKNYECEIIKGSVEDKIAKTLSLLDSNKMLIGATFLHEGAVSTPFAFDAKEKNIINIKYSMKTKLQDILDFYYDYEIINANTQVEDAYLFVPKNKDYKKGEIDLQWINYSHTTKTGKFPNETNAKGEVLEVRFMDAFRKKTDKVSLPNFDNVILKINKAREVKTVSNDLEQDNTEYGSNKEWKELLVHINSYLAGYNGKVFKKGKTDFADQNKPSLFDLEGKQFSEVWTVLSDLEETKQIYIDKNKLQPYFDIKESSKVVWYDFEGFSLPFAPIDHVRPYNQVVFQVSTIVTENNVETEKENLVIDPQVMSPDDFIKISRAIYREGAQKYVVYNKSYELTRLREMQNILALESHKDLEEFAMHNEAISANTVDLCDLFVISSANKLPAIMLYDQKARYSIKNVEKHITSNNIDLPRKITPYKELEVPNGGAAMELAINRALNIIGEKEWGIKVAQLKKYCENDVRAMIMVYDYVDFLLKGSQND